MNPIPKRLKQVRKKAKLTQEKLGIIAGIDEFSSSARMNKYETGKRTPDYLTLKSMAESLNYPVEFFYSSDDCLADLILSYHHLNGNGKKKVLEYIKTL